MNHFHPIRKRRTQLLAITEYSRSAIDYVEKAQNKPDDYDFLFMFLGSDVGFVRSAGHLLSTFIYNDSKEICPHNNSP